MNILLLHNSYHFRGGEDVTVEQECALLREHGHDVRLLLERNDSISGIAGAASAACSAVYSARSRRRVAQELRAFRPDLTHVHNFFPLLSPSVYLACREVGVPVVQTLQNYRIICPGALLLRDGRPCEDCVRRTVPWPGVLHGCYRGSRAGTVAVAAMVGIHKTLYTWWNTVDAFIAVSDFLRRKLMEGGLPAEKLHVKPNFVTPDPGVGRGNGEFALYVGRLSEEKGIEVLLEAWKLLEMNIPLVIVGEGPKVFKVASTARTIGADYRGPLSRIEVAECMRRASLLVFPSVWYEALPLTIVEAFACGIPVVASRLGAMQEIVSDGSTGLLFNPGDPVDLARKVEWAWTHPREIQEMGRAARQEYEAKYTPEVNYLQLMQIYQRAIDSCRVRNAVHSRAKLQNTDGDL